jgi:hypothetical protein
VTEDNLERHTNIICAGNSGKQIQLEIQSLIMLVYIKFTKINPEIWNPQKAHKSEQFTAVYSSK